MLISCPLLSSLFAPALHRVWACWSGARARAIWSSPRPSPGTRLPTSVCRLRTDGTPADRAERVGFRWWSYPLPPFCTPGGCSDLAITSRTSDKRQISPRSCRLSLPRNAPAWPRSQRWRRPFLHNQPYWTEIRGVVTHPGGSGGAEVEVLEWRSTLKQVGGRGSNEDHNNDDNRLDFGRSIGSGLRSSPHLGKERRLTFPNQRMVTEPTTTALCWMRGMGRRDTNQPPRRLVTMVVVVAFHDLTIVRISEAISWTFPAQVQRPHLIALRIPRHIPLIGPGVDSRGKLDGTQSHSFLVHSNWETGASERHSRAAV